MQSIQLRPATSDDLQLTYQITKDAMRSYVEQTWQRWDERRQWQKHAENFTPQTHRIIQFDDAVAGFLATENRPDHVWLVKLYLLAIFRQRGIGTAVLERVVQEAETLGQPTRLRVLRVNTRAQALYARHGFNVVGETPERIFMEKSLRAPDVFLSDGAR